MLDIGTKVIVTDAVFDGPAYGLSEAQRYGEVIGHVHDGLYNIVVLDDGVNDVGDDLSRGPSTVGWLVLDDELEVRQG